LMDELDGLPYFVMDYIEGESLDRVITHDFRPPVKRSLRILIGVADALDSAHRNGIIHRDVKPGNIVVRKDGSPVLTDFSVARVDTWSAKASLEGPLAALEEFDRHDTPHEKIAGTAAFVAPERWLHREYDGRADIYGFGVMMYQLLTGNLPFDALEISEIREQHLKKDVPKPQPSPPPDLAAIIDRCLQKEPQHRFNSAAELRNALKSALEEIESQGAPAEGRAKPEPLLETIHAPIFSPRSPMPDLLPYTRALSVFLLVAVMACVMFVLPLVLLKRVAATLDGAGPEARGIPTNAPGIVLEEDFSDYLLERRFRVTGTVKDFRRLSDGAWIHLDAAGRDILLWSPSQREAIPRNATVTAKGMLVKNREPVEPKYFIYIESEENIKVADAAPTKTKRSNRKK
ncbi:MAG: serine/threonine-protein kinase, partial [bacterium]